MLCSLRCLPELAEATAAPAVSSCVVSPSPLARFLPLTSMPVGAESSSPPAMSPPWPPSPIAATERVTVLSTPPGVDSTHPLFLLCAATPFSLRSELRPPRLSSSPSFPASPRPTAYSDGCAQAPATRSRKPLVDPCPIARTRSPPPCCVLAGDQPRRQPTWHRH